MAIDLKSLCLSQDFDAGDAVHQVELKIRKPKKDKFIRVRPVPLVPGVIGIYEDKQDKHNTVYVVTPAMMSELEGHAVRAVLRLAINTDGKQFIWWLRMANKKGEADEWVRSATETANQAETLWIRQEAGDGEYVRFVAARQDRPQPVWLSESESDQEIVDKAIRDCLIAAVDHPIIQRLRGEL